MKLLHQVVLVFVALVLFILVLFVRDTPVAAQEVYEVRPLGASISDWLRLEPKQYLFLKYPDYASILEKVSYCESGFKQFSGNDVLRGRINNQDIGLFQINTKYNLTFCESYGYDIFTEQGNIDCAVKLYEQRGLQPWEASKPCWENL